MSLEEECGKQLNPPCETKGAGDVTASQRIAEQQGIFKTPTRPVSKASGRLVKAGSEQNLSGNRRQGTPRPKRSSSLDDEASPRRQANVERKLNQRKRTPARQPMATSPSREALAARRICQAMVLNSYRRQRRELQRLQDEHQVAVNQEAVLSRKAETLRTLRDDEHEHLLAAGTELEKLNLVLQESLEDKDDLLRQQAELEDKALQLEGRQYRLLEKNKNMKNTLQDARINCQALESRLLEERLKLKGLEKEKKELEEKMELVKARNISQTSQIHDLLHHQQTLDETYTENSRQIKLKQAQMDACAVSVAAMQETQKQINSDHVLLTSQQASLAAAILELHTQLEKQDEEKEMLDKILEEKA